MKKIGGEELTDKQATFVALVAEGHLLGRAAEIAGFDFPRQAASRLHSLPHIQRAIYEHRQSLLATEHGSQAIKTMVELMQPGMPVTVRFTAAKWIAEAAGHGAVHMVANPLKSKHPSEMNEAELYENMLAMRAVVEQMRAAGSAAPEQHDPAKLLEGKADPVPAAV